MGEYHIPQREAFYHTPMVIALALQTAAAERRGQRPAGVDFADQAGDRAVAALQTGPHKR
jgi:hypothetical protein